MGTLTAAAMADNKPQPPPAAQEARFAKRIVDTSSSNQDGLTAEQVRFIRHVEMEQWKKRSQALKGRNVLTGLAIGAITVGIYGYTFYSVSQERIMDELDEEAKLARTSEPKTGAN